MCVIGSALMHSLIDGYGRSYGLIYVQLQSRFDSSAALTAVVGSACIAVRMCCSEFRFIKSYVGCFVFRIQ